MAGFIGPIPILMHTPDSNAFNQEKTITQTGNILSESNVTENETINVLVTNENARRLQGLNQWGEIFWINTNTALPSYHPQKHECFALIDVQEVKFYSDNIHASVKLNIYPASHNPYEKFEMDYSRLNTLPTTYDLSGIDIDLVSGDFVGTLLTSGGLVKVDTANHLITRYPTANDGNVNYGSGGVNWSNINNMYASDSSYAYASSPSGYNPTKWMVLRGFDFSSIPANATIYNMGIGFYVNPTNSVVLHCKPLFADSTFGNDRTTSIASGGREPWLGYSNGTPGYWGKSAITPAMIDDASNFKVYMSLGSLNPAGYVNANWCKVNVSYRNLYGTYTSPIITAPAGFSSWDELDVTIDIPTGCSASYKVLDINDTVLLTSTNKNIDLSGLSFVDLKLQATLYANGTVSPSLQNVEVSYG